MNFFTMKQYMEDMGISKSTADRRIAAFLAEGQMIFGPKVRMGRHLVSTYGYPDVSQPEVKAQTNFWNDPFNKTGWRSA